jgi:hypothetical protein
MKMAVFRVERNTNYTTMSNYHLRDTNLSLKAKGLLSVFLSLPDEWHYSISGLMKITKEGRDCLTAVIKELEKAGYLVRYQSRDETGKIVGIEYVIYEKPQAEQAGCCGVRMNSIADSRPDAYSSAATGRNEEPMQDILSAERLRAKKPMTGNPSAGKPSVENPSTDKPSTENPVTDKPSTDKPSAVKPVTENPSTENPRAEKPVTENPRAGKPSVGNPMTDNPMTENPPGIITNESNTDKSNTESIKERDTGQPSVSRRYGLYGNVFLTDKDMEKLRAEFPSDYDRRIEELSEYMASKGKTYRNHLATIRSWARRDAARSYAEKPGQSRPYSHDMYRYREGESL